MSKPKRLGEILPNVLRTIERRMFRKRHFANRLTRFRHKKFVSGLTRIDEPNKVRCFGRVEWF